MKNLLTYVNPRKEFDEENKILVKVQIDNSLSLGWKKEDVLLITNFEYEYNEIKAKVIGDDAYCEFLIPTTKIFVIDYLFKHGMIEDDLYWYHDFDAYQLNIITESELELDIADLGVTNYGRTPRLCSASMFFKKNAGDIFEWVKEEVVNRKMNEEMALSRVIRKHCIEERIKRLNISYGFHRHNIRRCYKIATQPIKCIHFHPSKAASDFYLYGKNKINTVLFPERLIKIFKKHGIE